jgi:hypothetical protein
MPHVLLADADRPRYAPVEVRTGLSSDEFVGDYALRNRPVLIKGAFARPHPTWTLEGLSRTYGERVIRAEDTALIPTRRKTDEITLAALVESVLAASPQYRLRGHDFLATIPELRSELADYGYYSEYFPSGELSHSLWIAPAGNLSSFHHDAGLDNLNLQLQGRKVFLLAPPASYRSLYTLKFRVSGVNPFAPDLRRHPRFSDVEMFEATLEPMDLIFVPKYWWHCVYALEPSLNVNTWSAASGMAPADVIAQLPLAVQIFERLDRNATVHRVVEALAAGYGALSMGI